MNRFGIVLAAVLLAASVTGCAEQGNQNSVTTSAQTTGEALSGELKVNAEEGFDEDYIPVLKSYFTAIEKQDYEAYKATVYPPFFEKLTEYYKQQSPAKTMEEVFAGLHKQFDEDGYDGWTLTNLVLSYYKNKQGVSSENDASDFLEAFKKGGMIDDKFIEETKKAAKDMKDVRFSVYALYTGDEEAVPAVNGREILVLKTDDGTFLFG